MKNIHSYIVSSLPLVAVSFLCLGISALLMSPEAQAQQGRPPVVDAAGTVRQDQPASSTPAASSSVSNDLVFSLYQQIEQLQNEMATLRGIVEEQGHQLRRMQSEQRDRYLDLDRRLSGSGGATAGNGAVGENPRASAPEGQLDGPLMLSPLPVAGRDGDSAAASADPRPAQPSPVQGSSPQQEAVNDRSGDLAATPENEQDIYRLALNLLLDEGQYDESIRQFQRYIHYYPSGRYLTNAYYWQGEAMILEGRYDEAERTFRRVVDDYPQDPKAAGALLKMGVAYSQLGDRDRARETWESIRARYPESVTEIRAAEDYLNRLGR